MNDRAMVCNVPAREILGIIGKARGKPQAVPSCRRSYSAETLGVIATGEAASAELLRRIYGRARIRRNRGRFRHTLVCTIRRVLGAKSGLREAKMARATRGENVPETARLAGAVALVTGGSRGIGRAIAIKLASLGAAVAICGRDEKSLRESEGFLRAASNGDGRFAAVKADVTQEDQVEELVSTVAGSLGNITILVNNAGIGLFGPDRKSVV